jgi:hypothetical protein
MRHLKVETPLLVPVLAAVPVCACMAILGLPAYRDGHIVAFRSLFFVACLLWLVPLTLIQRAAWRRQWRWGPLALLLLVLTYGMSLINSLLGQRLQIELGLSVGYRWAELARGLDSCWLALISFCAVHAGAAYYLSLQSAQLQLAQARAAARDAELHALRLQVNPHFLFNSLNAISALVAAGANREANRMLGSVADFLRAVLAHDGRHEHALAEELALLEAYLEIEKARLGERLVLTMKCGPDLFDHEVPYLMLQPLVENAIRHGIAPLAAKGRLDILLRREGSYLLVDIHNDGQPAARPKEGSGGSGLANVAERLRHLYGGDQRFDAGWDAQGRFGVHIALPLRRLDAAA